MLENIFTTVKTLNIIIRASNGLANWAKGAFRPVREAVYPIRYCSLYGASMATCICNFDPVEDVNLQELRQYCWFATKDVDKMANTHNMLYWWYMTNTYNICGKGNRLDPTACLKAAI